MGVGHNVQKVICPHPPTYPSIPHTHTHTHSTLPPVSLSLSCTVEGGKLWRVFTRRVSSMNTGVNLAKWPWPRRVFPSCMRLMGCGLPPPSRWITTLPSPMSPWPVRHVSVIYCYYGFCGSWLWIVQLRLGICHGGGLQDVFTIHTMFFVSILIWEIRTHNAPPSILWSGERWSKLGLTSIGSELLSSVICF